MFRHSFLRSSRCLRREGRLQHLRQHSQSWQSRRAYAVLHPDANELDRSLKLPRLDVSKLTITKTSQPKVLTPNEKLVFGGQFTDHMLQNLSLDPANCVFHYGLECFEGMKAYKNAEGKIRLFRPYSNIDRLNKSAARIAFPTIEPDSFVSLLSTLVNMEKRFIPTIRGYSLYLRPTMIGTQPTVSIGPSNSALLYVICSPVGPYFRSGFKAISLEATDYAVRAWPKGAGNMKLGANYAACILPQLQASRKGFSQNLWLFGDEDYVTEAGNSNFFVAIVNKETGQKELLTAPLDGTILEGVTRDSVLGLARERLIPLGWAVEERKISMKEIVTAVEDGRLIEAFGSGTGATIIPIRLISYQGRLLNCGLKEDQEAGEISTQMKAWIEGIQCGDEPDHPWSVQV
ncbi:hypothetical protein MMC14_005885 [Varicellaria rhodocarpa]|nr:hypothetical protein [Varicellaria rhodocarpa]